ncbi:MAG: ATP-dependent helicase [Acidobacteriota bacterium]
MASRSGSSRPADAPIDFENELNTAQHAAVHSADGPHLVIAGAGTGKTRTLVYRVANLVLQGVHPESILLLTFTRRAAQEMLRRATGLLDERCHRVAGGTFHSFANIVLRRFAEPLGYRNSFTIIDRSDCVDLIGILRSEGGYDSRGRRFPRAETLLNLISKEVNTNRPLEQLLEDEYPQFEDDLEPIEELKVAYAERKRQQNVMDYDDLLVQLCRLLVEHGPARRQLASTYRYVMIDEYQDTNRLQAHIGALLASTHANIMVVGDDAQSIYGFRGASFRNIIDFPKIFPAAKTILLEQNYRSTQPILDLGNAILTKAREKYSKRLFTEISGDEKPVLLRTTDEYSQASYICDRVLELREEGVPLQDIAVLCRAAWHTNTLELELNNRNIPFRKFGGIKFVEAAHIKDVSALLKLGVNPLDAAAWFRILQFFEGIGPKTARRLAEAIVEARGDFATLVDPKVARRKYGPDLEALHELLQKISRPRLPLIERVDTVLETYQGWMPKKFDDATRRMRDLEALAVIAERYTELEEFLTDLAIDPPDFSRAAATLGTDSEDEWMTLSTVHSAKGLEWHTVFVVQMNMGRFPGYNSLQDADDYEEERRLFYVAVTRAKNRLFLIKPEEQRGRGGYFEVAELSPLVSELDKLDDLVVDEVFAPTPEGEDWEGEGAGAEDSEQLQRIQDYFS